MKRISMFLVLVALCCSGCSAWSNADDGEKAPPAVIGGGSATVDNVTWTPLNPGTGEKGPSAPRTFTVTSEPDGSLHVKYPVVTRIVSEHPVADAPAAKAPAKKPAAKK